MQQSHKYFLKEKNLTRYKKKVFEILMSSIDLNKTFKQNSIYLLFNYN